jgi:hypothetical protein
MDISKKVEMCVMWQIPLVPRSKDKAGKADNADNADKGYGVIVQRVSIPRG